ncbi:MAG: hypothetical protein MUO64_00870 [Anaerolineales bacterium]|jgi:hypothetical protein|nr:hypothetical protein [Anaerolineales bacterium]
MRVETEGSLYLLNRWVALLDFPHFLESLGMYWMRAPQKQPSYHPFTADNQDYRAYICLMLGVGMFDLDQMILSVNTGSIRHFEDILAEAKRRRLELASTRLKPVHDEV